MVRQQLFHAGAVAHTQTGGVAYLAHVGGFIFWNCDGALLRKPTSASFATARGLI